VRVAAFEPDPEVAETVMVYDPACVPGLPPPPVPELPPPPHDERAKTRKRMVVNATGGDQRSGSLWYRAIRIPNSIIIVASTNKNHPDLFFILNGPWIPNGDTKPVFGAVVETVTVVVVAELPLGVTGLGETLIHVSYS
jgi:hypothetical protein